MTKSPLTASLDTLEIDADIIKKLNDNDLIQDYTYALNDFFETFIYFASQSFIVYI